jgi:hypothetical protein
MGSMRYTRRPGPALGVRVRLAAADPANAAWQRDLKTIRQKIDSLDG